MRIGATVVRVKNTWAQSEIGDIRVINAMKIYNKGLCLNLEGDKPDTFHSGNDFRLIEDVDMPCLEAKLAIVAEKAREALAKTLKDVDERSAKMLATKRKNKMSAVEIFDEIIKEPFDFPDEPEMEDLI